MTNKFAEKVNDITTTLVQMGRVPINYLPARGDEPDDKAIAEIATSIREVMYEEADVDSWLGQLAGWFVLTGNAFLIPYYDRDEKFGTVKQPLQSCQQCGTESSSADIVKAGGKCPKCGATSLKPSENSQSFNVGRFATDVCSPFEIRLDHRTIRMDEHRKFVRMRMWDLDYAKEKYKDIANQITADHENDLGQFYLNALAHVTSAFGLTGGFVGGATNPTGPKTVVYEHFELPDEHYPEGLWARRIGANSDLIVEAGPLESEYGAGPRKGQKFLPLVHFGFDTVPGRFWFKTRADDLIPQQMHRNQIEAVIRLTTQRGANGIWLLPKGCGVVTITGEPMQIIDYNPISVGGTSMAKPERIPSDIAVIQGLVMYMNKIDDNMERLMGTFFLQGGDTPPGVTAASALAYLGERAQRSMASPAREWATGFKRWEEMSLEIFRKEATDQRILTVAGTNRQWEVSKFAQAELGGSVKMKIDYNGIFPKSIATERANIQQLVQMGFVSPLDPEMAFRVLEKFGETDLKDSMDIVVREATKENEMFLEDEDYTPKVVPIVQDSEVHLPIHMKMTATDEFKELSPDRQQVMFQHIQDTFQDIYTKKMLLAQLAAQGQQGQQPGGPQGQGGPEPPTQTPPTPDIAASAAQPGGGAPVQGGGPMQPVGGVAQEAPLPVQ
jgi:hypothetical protein